MPGPPGTPPDDAVEQALARSREQRERERGELAQAKASAPSEKEPFSVERFAALYDLTDDRGELHLTPDLVERYEYEYYVRRPELRSLEAFAAIRTELDSHDAG